MVPGPSGRKLALVGCYTRPRQADPFGGVRYAEEHSAVGGGVALLAVAGTGELVVEQVLDVGPNPSFVCVDRENRKAYCVNEAECGAVTELGLGPGPEGGVLLAASGRSLPTHGGYPCALTALPGGGPLVAACYGGGCVSVFARDANGGLVGDGPAAVHAFEGAGSFDVGRQEAPHAHSVVVSPGGKRALVADLGADRLRAFSLEAAPEPVPGEDVVMPEPGGGARHLAWHPNGRFAFVVLEMAAQVAAYRAADGPGAHALELVGVVSTLPLGWPAEDDDIARFNKGRWAADVAVHPNGRTVYVSNRLHDSVASFAVDQETGALTPTGHTPSGGVCPRSFALSDDGGMLLVAHQHSHSVVSFLVDRETGELSHTGHTARLPLASCVRYLPGASDTYLDG